MSIELCNAESELGQFASNAGYSDLITASQSDPVLKKFFDDASTEEVAKVAGALKKLEASEDVIQTAHGLADLMKGQSLVFISNGTHDKLDEDDVEKGGPGSGIPGHTTPRPKGRGPTQARTITKVETNSGAKVNLYSLSNGQNINTDDFRNAIFKEDQGLVRIIYDNASGNLIVPDAGLQDLDHGNFIADAKLSGDPDTTSVRGVLDLNSGAINLYDMRSESEAIAANVNRPESSVEKLLANNLKAASKSTFYVNGKRVRFETEDIQSVLGFTKVDFVMTGEVVKLNRVQQLVFGWASIVNINGKEVTDTQGDIIAPDTMESAAYEYVLTARKGGEMHETGADGQARGVSRLVESVAFTREKQLSMVHSLHNQGIEDAVLDLHCEAWWIGFKVDNPQTWARVESGELKAFSIGGKGKRDTR